MENYSLEKCGENLYKLPICKKIYEKLAILNAIYKFANLAYFKLELYTDTHILLLINIKKGILIDDLDMFAGELLNEINDQQIRLDLEQRTGEIKKLIYEKAFAPVRKK